ncbi:helix-turn-helix transcriptional regulator [Halorubellus salinus]|uniref:helix-turn-helix transcriptional regulator n=1 Tax=Halorubellus salinus TaxID=755309 RepID=UPI001D07EB8C|nr:hypothetical protein [Halorubellus salinus]
MRFRPALVGILLLLVVSGAVVAADGARSDGVGSTAAAESTEFERADPGLVVTVQLRADGDARWHITHRFLVNGTNETRAFERYADDVRSGNRDLGVGRETFARFAAAASETTDREMQIRDANWTDSTVENGTGTVTYSFTWTNFGRVDGESLFVGDAFRSPDGTWFPRLYDGQRLVIRPPEGLNIVRTPPDKGLDQRALVWDGYREFEPGYLSVVLERPVATTTSTTPSVNTSTGEPVTPDDSFLLGVGFALLLMFVGAGSYFFARWQTQQDDGDGPAGVPEASDGGDSSAGSGTTGSGSTTTTGSDAASTPPEPDSSGLDASRGDASSAVDAGDATGGATAAGTAGAAVEDADDDTEDEIDEALLSDEERVLRLLEGNGGRMKQANIVTETGWSNAKVSQLLSGMHDDDEIQKLRIGRENLIALPEENVADFGDDE